MLKTVGLTLVFISCTAFGIYTANKKRTALKVNQKTLKMLHELKSMLRFNQPSKSDIIGALHRLGYGDCIKTDDTLIKDYFDRLGTRDLKSELEGVEQCIERYSEFVQECEKATDGGCKLAIGSGVLIGTFIVVMLV